MFGKPLLRPLSGVWWSTILLQNDFCVWMIVPLDPREDMALQNFEISIGVDATAVPEEGRGHPFAITCNQTKHHDPSWVLGSESELDIVWHISGSLRTDVALCAAVRDWICGEKLFICEKYHVWL
jgi:hypothetical protein